MSKRPRKSKKADKLRIAVRERGSELRSDDSKYAKAMEFARRSFRKYAYTYKALANNDEAGKPKA